MIAGFSSSASKTSPTALGWGYVPGFPSSIVFSDSTLINSILSDIPYLITGLLGFAVLTFFLIVRQSSRYVCIVGLAVTCEFLAAIFDLDQLLQRGDFAVQTGIDISPPIIIVREIMLSLAPGFFFLFFWFFVALPPRGELQPPYNNQPYSRTLGILTYPGAYHCGRWDRWGILGMFLQWMILAVVFAVPALQIARRLAAFDVPFGTIYNASVTTEILLSCLFILKINGNVWLSNLGEKWRAFRDYTPILFCLVIGLGIRIGDVEVFKFSDAPLGRFLQAVEIYVLFLYILCATFYPPPTSSNQSLLDASLFMDPGNRQVRKLDMRFKPNLKESDAKSTSLIKPPQAFGVDSRLLPFPTSHTQGPSISSYQLPVDEENQLGAPASSSRTGLLKVQNNDCSMNLPKRRTSIAGDSSLAVVISRDNTSPAPRLHLLSMAESSPVYGLNGIIRGSTIPSSINSRVSDLSFLCQRQADLDKSVEGLLRFTKDNNVTDVKSPTDSDFSLSNFPEPPIMKTTSDSTEVDSANQKQEFVMGNTIFSLVPPSIPAGHERQASVPLSMQGSEDGLIVGAGRDRFPSNATRYDVTSFIGGYAVAGNVPGSPLRRSDREEITHAFQVPRGIDERDSIAPARNFLPPRAVQIRRGQDPPFISPLNPNRSNINVKLQQVQKLDISRPLQRFSVEDAMAYERPRDAPVVGNIGTSTAI